MSNATSPLYWGTPTVSRILLYCTVSRTGIRKQTSWMPIWVLGRERGRCPLSPHSLLTLWLLGSSVLLIVTTWSIQTTSVLPRGILCHHRALHVVHHTPPLPRATPVTSCPIKVYWLQVVCLQHKKNGFPVSGKGVYQGATQCHRNFIFFCFRRIMMSLG